MEDREQLIGGSVVESRTIAVMSARLTQKIVKL